MDISEEEIKKARESGSFSDEIDPQLLRAIKKMQAFKSQDDILKVIEEKREERRKKAEKEREEKIKKILDKE